MNGPAWNRLINRQADGLGPVMKYHYGEWEEAFLHNPDYPREDFNEVWRTAVENAEPQWPSPFVNGNYVDRVFEKHTDMVRENAKSGRQAARDIARDVNRAIIEMLVADPSLQGRYLELVAQGARPAWDSPEPPPELLR